MFNSGEGKNIEYSALGEFPDDSSIDSRIFAYIKNNYNKNNSSNSNNNGRTYFDNTANRTTITQRKTSKNTK